MGTPKKGVYQSKEQQKLLEKVRTIKNQFEMVLKKYGGVERVRNYSGNDMRMRELHRILAAFTSLISNQPNITPSRINEICNSLKMAAAAGDKQQSIHIISRVSVRLESPLSLGMFEAEKAEWKSPSDSICKGLTDILKSDTMNELRSMLDLPLIEERQFSKTPTHTKSSK